MDGDWAAVLTYQRDPLYLRLYPWTYRSEADVRSLVQTFLDQQREEPRHRFQLTIALKVTKGIIGNCGIRRKPDNDWEGDIGYELAPELGGEVMPRRRPLRWLSSAFES